MKIHLYMFIVAIYFTLGFGKKDNFVCLLDLVKQHFAYMYMNNLDSP